MLLISFSQLTFFNISTANEAYSSPATTFSQTSCLIYSCLFSLVCDAYDGGIVPSLNNPLASLTASNTSFVGCCRKRNVECNGTAEVPLKPVRQSTTTNGANSFIWCEWNGSKTTGTENTWEDIASNGGAICMHSQSNAIISIKHCSFNDCNAYCDGGGVMCAKIKSVEIENNSFNSCTAQKSAGGGMCIYVISTCVQISGCEFQDCKANGYGGGLYLDNFQVSGPGCIPTENGGGESACVFDCSFASCSVTSTTGGGMRCYNIPVQVKIRSIQFISCNASSYGGGLSVDPRITTAPKDGHYCYFLFFHECKCSATSPRGHDIAYTDYYKHFLDSGNPFNECYTTNADDRRMFYEHYDGTNWVYDQISKKDWLKDKTIYVSANGNDEYELCGSNESNPCLTVKKAFEMCEIQISLSVTLMEGDHRSETTTIDIGAKKISAVGKEKKKNAIGRNAVLPLFSAPQLFILLFFFHLLQTRLLRLLH